MYVDVPLYFLMFKFRSICVVKFLSNVFLCLLSNSLLFCTKFISLSWWFLCGVLCAGAGCQREPIDIQLACGALQCSHGL